MPFVSQKKGWRWNQRVARRSLHTVAGILRYSIIDGIYIRPTHNPHTQWVPLHRNKNFLNLSTAMGNLNNFVDKTNFSNLNQIRTLPGGLFVYTSIRDMISISSITNSLENPSVTIWASTRGVFGQFREMLHLSDPIVWWLSFIISHSVFRRGAFEAGPPSITHCGNHLVITWPKLLPKSNSTNISTNTNANTNTNSNTNTNTNSTKIQIYKQFICKYNTQSVRII